MPLHRTLQAPKRVVSPNFPIPDGLEDVVHDDSILEDDLWQDPEDDDDDPETRKKSTKKVKRKRVKKKVKRRNRKKDKKKKRKKRKDDHKGNRGVGTPKTLQIVKQTVRTKADGSQVVDILVEVEKKAAADTYQFRLTKKDTGVTTVV